MIDTKSINMFLGLMTAFLLTLGFLVAIPIYSQVVGGTLSGTITDASGAAIPNATVSIKNVATGVTTNAASNAQGLYNAPNLLPGTYEARVTAAGFDTKAVSNIILTVGAQQVLNFSMKVGTISEKVEVSEIAPDLQLVSSTISGVIDSNTVLQLPLNGRSWTELAALQPGVSTIRAMVSVASPDRLGRGLGVQLSVTGGRPQQNNYLLNGVSINDYSNQSPGSILGGNLGVDAVAEFSVLTTNYSAEYGRTSGGVVSAIGRSGTNQFHGSAFEFLRNSALDARNFFDGPIPAFRRNQFGASAGGPIRKDRTFIFGAYEGVRQALGTSIVDNVPSDAVRGIGTGPGGTAGPSTLCSIPLGDPMNPCTTTILTGASTPDPTTGIDTAVLPYLAFYPHVNNGLIGNGDTGIFIFGGSQITSENYFTTWVDNKFSEKDNLSGSYMFDNSPSSQNDEFKNKLLFNRARRQLVTLEENHVFTGSLGNSFRLGYSRVFAAAPAGSKAINPLAADTTLGFLPGETVGTIGGSGTGLTLFTGGLSAAHPAVFHWNSWQAYDNAFLTKGTHSFKFGANGERIENNQFTPSRPGGEFDFNSLADFLTNGVATFTADERSTSKGVRETIFGAYVQDDFHFRPNLALNLGLRYEMATVPTEVHGELASLQHLTDPTVVVRSPLFANPSLRNFEPRVGFSWDPFRNGKTAVRGGFGMFDVLVLPANLRHTVDGTVPFSQSANGSNLKGLFPKAAFAALSVQQSSERAAFIEQNPPRNYVMQWNLNIQREIASGTTVMAAYVGSHALHNTFQTDDSDIVLPIAKTPFGYLWPLRPPPPDSNSAPPTLPTFNPNFARIALTTWGSSSLYHALEVQVKKRMSHGFEAQASYTFGRSIDSSSGSTDGDQFQNGLTSMMYFDQGLRRGLSDFNQSHKVVVSYTWDVPSSKNLTGVLGWAASGWEFGGIFEASSGLPFTAVISPDPLGMNSTDQFALPDRVKGCNPIQGGFNYLNVNCFVLPPQPASLAGQCQPFGFRFPDPTVTPQDPGSPGIAGTCGNLLGNGGRNTLIGPSLVNLDLSVFKNSPIRRISELFNVQFRFEVFNILNHANFNPPTANNAVFDGTGAPVGGAGQLNGTSTTSRQIQFALKFVW
ncbi:MAG TPA: TonB-dependent receptor [Candidatus Acidoferrum sp.]|nr:TonB-dependent receptor [Candidatus Acidoferrum sp.]